MVGYYIMVRGGGGGGGGVLLHRLGYKFYLQLEKLTM